MRDIGGFWEFCVTRGAWILIGSAVVEAIAVQSSRYLRGTEAARYRLEMFLRTIFNVFLFLFAVVFTYQAMRIANLHKVLVEMNAPFYEGGQVAEPVADEDELNRLRDLTNRATILGVSAFVFFVIGSWRQYRRRARYWSSAAVRRTRGLETDERYSEPKPV